MTNKRHYACVCCVFVVIKLNITAQQAGRPCRPINGHPMPYGKYSKTSCSDHARQRGAGAGVGVRHVSQQILGTHQSNIMVVNVAAYLWSAEHCTRGNGNGFPCCPHSRLTCWSRQAGSIVSSRARHFILAYPSCRLNQ